LQSSADQTYSIRRATLDDADTIVAQRKGMLEEIRKGDIGLLDTALAAFEHWLISNLNAEKYLGWLAVSQNGTVVAGLGLWLIEWPPSLLSTSPYRGYILNVYTDVGHRKQGLARRLTQTALDWCRENGINVIDLHASPYGRPLYESLGFEANNQMRLILPKE
jgi:GNAT superfamily N-acetyltransferase